MISRLRAEIIHKRRLKKPSVTKIFCRDAVLAAY